MAGGRKESVSVGIASGHHTLSAGVEEHPVTYQSLVFRLYLLCCFFIHLFTQIVFPSTPLLFKLCISQYECMLLL